MVIALRRTLRIRSDAMYSASIGSIPLFIALSIRPMTVDQGHGTVIWPVALRWTTESPGSPTVAAKRASLPRERAC